MVYFFKVNILQSTQTNIITWLKCATKIFPFLHPFSAEIEKQQDPIKPKQKLPLQLWQFPMTLLHNAFDFHLKMVKVESVKNNNTIGFTVDNITSPLLYNIDKWQFYGENFESVFKIDL